MGYIEKVFENMVEHYAKLATTPGWYDYARYEVAKMMKDCPQLWGDLGARVKQRIEEKKIESGVGLSASGVVSESQERQALGGDARSKDNLSGAMRLADNGAKAQAQLESARGGD